MREQGSAATRDGLIIASGYGLKIYVRDGHLVVHDGVGRRRQTRRFHRATGGLRRVVVLGHDGYVTLDALHWLQQAGATLTQLDHHGQLVVQSTANGPDISALRRSQAAAAAAPVGVEVARWLLAEKVDGQAAVAKQLPDFDPRCGGEISRAVTAIESATAMQELLAGEAAAASAYWTAWATVALPFPRSQTSRLPDHWLTVGPRHSPLTRSPRLAASPAHAILNYLYGLLEAETTLALQTIGLDPGLGLFHADKPGRASMSLDVMEACRPVVDAYLLALLTERTLSPREFVETPRGVCRLRPAFAKQLAETPTVWASHVAPVAERVAQMLAHAAGQPLPTKLTQATRSESRPGGARPTKRRLARLPESCRDCGIELADRRHRYCPRCRDQRWSTASKAGRVAAASALDQLRSEGTDPAHGGQAARSRGAKNAAHQAALRAWKGDRPKAETFMLKIGPALRDVPIAALTEATGLSEHYCSLIRLGKRVPHPRHWAALGHVASKFGVP